MSIHDRVVKILTDQLGVDDDEVTPSAHIENDLGADSLDLIEIVMACEEEFKLEIPDEDAQTMTDVKSVTSYLEARLQ